MATVKYVRESKDSRLLLLGVTGEGESAGYTVNEQIYAELGCPTPGEELSDGDLERIRQADRLYRARKKALSLLAYADNNRRSLITKLIRAGFSRDIASAVCDEMTELGYIDEERQLRRIILNEANSKLRGPGKIIPALAARGYSVKDVRRVMSILIDEGELDFSKNAGALVKKHLPPDSDYEEKRKLLFKNGYKI